jgi:IQ calmodulin-binding motif
MFHRKQPNKRTVNYVPPLEKLICVQFDNVRDYYKTYKSMIEINETYDPIYIYPIKLINRLRSIIRIQAWWRGYYFRK